MDFFIGFLISFIIIIFGILNNAFVGFLLLACGIIFALIGIKNGYNVRNLFMMSYSGGKKALVVVKTLLLIGAVTGSWMASGTIPGIVYYSLKLIHPNSFILFAFVICSLTSFLLGSATGTASIVGLPLIIIARSGNVNLSITAGAIIAGVYFGDRCSPMSSSAALVANLTTTELFINIKNMLRTSLLPFILSLGFYFLFSRLNPLKVVNLNLTSKILSSFQINYMVMLPIAVILLLCLLKVKIQLAMLLSMFTASIISIVLQGYGLFKVLNDILFGFKLDSHNMLFNIIKGGGVNSMLKACVVVFIACALAGILEGMQVFSSIKTRLAGMKLTGSLLYGMTAIIGTITAAFGCTQSIAVVMTEEIMKNCYQKDENYQFALDMENSCILTSALIPWNIAALICTTTLNVNMHGYIPYAFYLYSFPILHFSYLFVKEKLARSRTNRLLIKL